MPISTSLPTSDPAERLAIQAALGVLGAVVAILTVDIVTRRDMVVALISGGVLALIAPDAIMAAMGWSDPRLIYALAFLCAVSGKSLMIHVPGRGAGRWCLCPSSGAPSMRRIGRRSGRAGGAPTPSGAAGNPGAGGIIWRGGAIRSWGARARHLAASPLCVFCLRRGVTRLATVVDHIVPHRGDWRLFWDAENHQALCDHCHSSEKQSQERRAAASGPGGAETSERGGWETSGGAQIFPRGEKTGGVGSA